MFSQKMTATKWIEDLDTLESQITHKPYLFEKRLKTNFKNDIKRLKKELPNLNNDAVFWRIQSILKSFKNTNLNAEKSDFKTYNFKVKWFKKGLYLIGIDQKHSTILKQRLIAINGFSIKNITQNFNKVFYQPNASIEKLNIEKWINNQSLLAFLKISKSDFLQLTIVSEKGEKTTINLANNDIISDWEWVRIRPKKPLFSERRNQQWFWMYGINFGQQVFFRHQVCLSKEHIKKLKDSLNWSSYKYAQNYNIPLQSVYDATNFDKSLKKLVSRFKKRRYKKLIIDYRNCKTGSLWDAQKLIHTIIKIKRINKKGKLILLVDKNLSNIGRSIVFEFQKQTKAIVIGEKSFGTRNDSDKLKRFKLKNSELLINYPTKTLKIHEIKPDIIIEPTLEQFKNGIDPFLQKALQK
jgi:hypothetical protein